MNCKLHQEFAFNLFQLDNVTTGLKDFNDLTKGQQTFYYNKATSTIRYFGGEHFRYELSEILKKKLEFSTENGLEETLKLLQDAFHQILEPLLLSRGVSREEFFSASEEGEKLLQGTVSMLMLSLSFLEKYSRNRVFMEINSRLTKSACGMLGAFGFEGDLEQQSLKIEEVLE